MEETIPSEAEDYEAPKVDRLTTLPKPTTPVAVRERLIEMLRRDLVGPCPDRDPDLAREVLAGASPSTFYLTGFFGPRRGAMPTAKDSFSETAAEDQAELQLEAQRGSEGMEQGATRRGVPADEGASERPPSRSFTHSSLGLTVLLPRDATKIEARVTWGDYVIEPPLDVAVVLPAQREAATAAGERPKEPRKETLAWRRIPREERVPISLAAAPSGEAQTIDLWNSAAPQVPGGCLRLVVSVRPTRTPGIDGVHRDLLAVSVFLVNARPEAVRRFGDVAFAFQAKLELIAPGGFAPRDDRASYDARGFDARLADLHYRDVSSYAVGHITSGDWAPRDDAGRVTHVFTNPIPIQEVEKLGADLNIDGVERGMEKLAEAALDPNRLAWRVCSMPSRRLTRSGPLGRKRQFQKRHCRARGGARSRANASPISRLREPASRAASRICSPIRSAAKRSRSLIG